MVIPRFVGEMRRGPYTEQVFKSGETDPHLIMKHADLFDKEQACTSLMGNVIFTGLMIYDLVTTFDLHKLSF